MPKSSRPPEIRSSVAACSASSTGLCQGSTMTAVPSRKRGGAHGERRLQHQGGGDLVPAGEMMLDQEARAIAQRLGLDRVVEIIAEALPGFRAEILRAGLGRAEDSELHSGVTFTKRRGRPRPFDRRSPARSVQRPPSLADLASLKLFITEVCRIELPLRCDQCGVQRPSPPTNPHETLAGNRLLYLAGMTAYANANPTSPAKLTAREFASTHRRPPAA